ncbi:MAG TPA: potassium/proton antiporter [Thermoanaerobaculia bacterium]|nr:potassium/proton antiporter [Thermoanaerobaculia bacterium]
MHALTTGLLISAVLLLASILASKAAARFGVPALLLFLGIGMLAGSDGPGGIWFDDVQLAQSIGVVALALILYSGGLDTPWHDVRPALASGLSLATFGVVVSAAIIGGAAYYFLDFPLPYGLLLGAIVSSTDAAAVFSVLRSRGVRLRGRLQPLIELESGSNDPMAVFLTLALIERILKPSAPLLGFFVELVLEMSIGAVAGIALGRLAVWTLNRIRLEIDGLYLVLSLAFVMIAYAATDLLHGNGFLAVYVAGVVMGNRRFIHRRAVMRFHDGLAWLMQIAMFLALGLLVFPSHLAPVAGLGLTVAIVATFIARPVAVFVALSASQFGWREKLFIAWTGLRGAVPIILATFAMTAKLPGGATIFNIVFFSVLVSVLLQGSTIPAVARWLRLSGDAPSDEGAMRRESDLLTIDLQRGAPAIGRQLVELALPSDTLVLLVYRGNEFFPTTGATTFVEGDRLMVFTSKKSVGDARAVLQGT